MPARLGDLWEDEEEEEEEEEEDEDEDEDGREDEPEVENRLWCEADGIASASASASAGWVAAPRPSLWASPGPGVSQQRLAQRFPRPIYRDERRRSSSLARKGRKKQLRPLIAPIGIVGIGPFLLSTTFHMAQLGLISKASATSSGEVVSSDWPCCSATRSRFQRMRHETARSQSNSYGSLGMDSIGGEVESTREV